jgi:hypothetical protein
VLKHLVRKGEAGKKPTQQIDDGWAVVDAFLDARGRIITEAFLPVLQQRLPSQLAVESGDPELAAQAEWMAYLGEMNALETQLISEMPAKLPGPFAAADGNGNRAELDEYVTDRVRVTMIKCGVEAALVVMRELDAARAARGLPPIDLSSEGDDSKLSGLSKAYTMARVMRRDTRRAFSDILEQRALGIQANYLELFRQRLKAVGASPVDAQATAAGAEWREFRRQIDNLAESLRVEMRGRMPDFWALANLDGAEARVSLDAMIETRVAELVKTLKAAGAAVWRTSDATRGVSVPD